MSNRRKLPPPPPEPLEELPCGCKMGSVGDAFVMQPCSTDCQYFRYAVAETKRQGKAVHTVDARPKPPGPPTVI